MAIKCIGGKFQPERVPIFVTLKDFAEALGQPDLLAYINRLIPMFSRETPHDVGARHPGSFGLSTKVDDAVPLHEIIRHGRALILLDGLDEVRDADSRRVCPVGATTGGLP
ncbi:hypothetical protein [Microseira sp. BLCC-F43]|uniref:hypothetical protein n=1 Tax=Microseira sp. BLCC-F43 TaxID=3153602 RepID=UPI0035B98D50